MEPNVHYLVHKSLPQVLILSQKNSIYTLPSLFLEIHFNIILTSTLMSLEWSFPFMFSAEAIVGNLIASVCMGGKKVSAINYTDILCVSISSHIRLNLSPQVNGKISRYVIQNMFAH
jgi:hypothetical protein